MMVIMIGSTMHEAEHDLKAIVYPAYDIHHDCAQTDELKSSWTSIHLYDDNGGTRNHSNNYIITMNSANQILFYLMLGQEITIYGK